MLIIRHRVNKIEDLVKTPLSYGVEIDIREDGGRLLLSHDRISPEKEYDELEDYLKNFRHAFIIFNVKEAGIEQEIIDLAKKYSISQYFLLDVEFPFFYRASRKNGFRKIAVRYSEAEPIEFSEAQIIDGKPLVDWVWIDTNTQLPLDEKIISKLGPFKTCLVCPERWGRPEDVKNYMDKMKKLSFKPDAVMTSIDCAKEWGEL
jgi:hypothetical protein